jgi:PAS domain S-box-containing protein
MGAWIWNLATDAMTYLESAGPISGQPPSQRPATGEAWFAQIVQGDRERVAAEFQRAIRNRTPYQIEFRLGPSDGAFRWVAARGHCFGEGLGPATALTGVDVDITERKEAE